MSVEVFESTIKADNYHVITNSTSVDYACRSVWKTEKFFSPEIQFCRITIHSIK